MINKGHQIESTIIEISFPNEETALSEHNSLESFMRKRMFSSISNVFDEFSEENTILESTKFKQTKKSRPILDISKYKININSLTNIIYMCKSLDIELRLIITPSNSNYDLYLKEFEKKFPNQSIWDFSKIKNLRSNDYYDSNHLNREGVLKLLKEMKKVNFF